MVEEITAEKIDATMTKIYDKVVRLAQEKPCVTGDYNLLTTYYWWTYCGRKFGIPFNLLLELPSPETICRAFRKAVENGDIKPTGRILARRAKREQAMRNVMVDLRENENGR